MHPPSQAALLVASPLCASYRLPRTGKGRRPISRPSRSGSETRSERMATVIQELKSIQDRFGYIPEKEMYSLARRINVPVYELNGVASFYPHFRLAPPPRATIHVCTDL